MVTLFGRLKPTHLTFDAETELVHKIVMERTERCEIVAVVSASIAHRLNVMEMNPLFAPAAIAL